MSEPQENPGLWAEIGSSFVQLIPVFGGAAVAWLAAYFQAAQSHRLTEKSALKAERRRKIEELVQACYEIEPWSDRQKAHHLWGREETIEATPAATIETIARLYAPSLIPQASALSAAIGKYREWLAEAGEKRLKMHSGDISFEDFEHHVLNMDNRKEVLEARNQLVAAAQKEAAALLGT